MYSKFTKIIQKKKSVSIDSKCFETRRNAKKLLPLWPIARKARAAKCNLTYPMSLQGFKGVSMPVSCRSDQNSSGEGFLYIGYKQINSVDWWMDWVLTYSIDSGVFRHHFGREGSSTLWIHTWKICFLWKQGEYSGLRICNSKVHRWVD